MDEPSWSQARRLLTYEQVIQDDRPLAALRDQTTIFHYAFDACGRDQICSKTAPSRRPVGLGKGTSLRVASARSPACPPPPAYHPGPLGP
jgi:hypothetical protein